jgi:hypothetical protein
MKKIFLYTTVMLVIMAGITGCDKEDEVIALTGITVDPQTVSLAVGETKKVTATPVPNNATGVKFVWNQENPAVATVDQSGLITITGAGNTNVTVSSGGISKTIAVEGTINSIVVKDAGENTSGEYAVGTTVQLTAVISPAGADVSPVWSSNNETVAGVNATGLVTITGAGNAVISAVLGNFKADYTLVALSPVEGLTKIREFSADDSPYTVTLYNETGRLQLGYTKVYFTVTDADGKFISNATLNAFPEMDMGMHKHSTPRSEITKVEGKALYEAYYSFLMYSGQGNGTWYYDLEYIADDVSHSFIDEVIEVRNVFRPDGTTTRRVIQNFRATNDGVESTYIVTLAEPQNPKDGLNEITAYIHRMEDSNTFPAVENLKLKLDPRMPSMGNHSSPNNVDLTWDATDKVYRGTVNFSMSGYWKVNLILQDHHGETLYGNAVTDETPASSLYFEVEF